MLGISLRRRRLSVFLTSALLNVSGPQLKSSRDINRQATRLSYFIFSLTAGWSVHSQHRKISMFGLGGGVGMIGPNWIRCHVRREGILSSAGSEKSLATSR